MHVSVWLTGVPSRGVQNFVSCDFRLTALCSFDGKNGAGYACNLYLQLVVEPALYVEAAFSSGGVTTVLFNTTLLPSCATNTGCPNMMGGYVTDGCFLFSLTSIPLQVQVLLSGQRGTIVLTAFPYPNQPFQVGRRWSSYC
jgi:hypothetical protein